MAPHDAKEVQRVKQPITWGNVISILVCHLLAMYGLLNLPLMQIWGKNPSLCPF
jgi:hypothetical protein